MDLIGDHVRPTTAEAKSILTKSYEIWSYCSRDVSRHRQLRPESVMLRRMLGKVPEFLPNGIAKGNYPNNLKISIRGSGRDSCLVIGGKSTRSTTEGSCDLEDKVFPQELLFGIQTSKTCSFESVSSFTDWPGIQGDHESSVEGNQLGIIALAWAYILSARWIELQETEPEQPNQKKPRRYYLNHQAEWQYHSQGSPDYIDVHLGDVDEEAWRWWAAILANGEGWRIEVDGNRRPYRSPWSIFIESGISQQFKLRGKIRTILPKGLGLSRRLLHSSSSERSMLRSISSSPFHPMSQDNHVSLAGHAKALPNRKRASSYKSRRHNFRRSPSPSILYDNERSCEVHRWCSDEFFI